MARTYLEADLAETRGDIFDSLGNLTLDLIILANIEMIHCL